LCVRHDLLPGEKKPDGFNGTFLQVKFITYAFYGGNAINPNLLPDLPDMHVNGAVAYDHIVPPYLAQDLITQEHPAGF
jgi:hypothetical protein